jgi:uncharacterized tellurite resistance protein B-like protein
VSALDPAKLPQEERVAYATVVGAMAAADDVVSKEEIARLRELGKTLKLSQSEQNAVIAAVEARDTKAAHRALDRLRSSDFRFTLYTDCLTVAYADDKIVPAEENALSEVAHALGVSDAQAAALREYVEAARDAARGEGDHASHEKRGKEVASKLAAVGIPVGAAALVSAAGLSIAGVTTGLTALAAGLGIASGFGVALGLGIGTAMGVRWLHQRVIAHRKQPPKKRYQDQDSSQTLREGLEEFHAGFDNVIQEKDMSSERARELFRCHDTCHVVFGCDTTVGNEVLVDTWSIFGTDVSVKEYSEYLRIPEAQQALTGAGFVRTLLESIRATPRLFDVFLRTREMTKKWPFYSGDAYLDIPLAEIRKEFNIQLIA